MLDILAMLLAIVSLADRGAMEGSHPVDGMEGSHPVDGMEVISTSRENSDTIRGCFYFICNF